MLRSKDHVKEISLTLFNNFWQFGKTSKFFEQGKLVIYFCNNVAKTCSYDLKISQNIEIKHLFHFEV